MMTLINHSSTITIVMFTFLWFTSYCLCPVHGWYPSSSLTSSSSSCSSCSSPFLTPSTMTRRRVVVGGRWMSKLGSTTQVSQVSQQCNRLQSSSLAMAMGGHNTQFKFLPIIRGSPEEHFPRIIHIAGVYPHLTYEDLLAPISPPAATPGAWSYDFPDADGPQLGSVALPGSDTISDCIDPVVVIAKNTDLGVSAPEELEMIVVIDRADRSFQPGKFFIFLTPHQTLDIKWMDKLEPGYEIVGKVALCAMPFTASMAPKATGFLEEDEY